MHTISERSRLAARPFNFFEKEDLFPVREENFEDTVMCFPKNLEKSLTTMFGDYMQLPPPEKRKNHYPHILEFPKEEVFK